MDVQDEQQTTNKQKSERQNGRSANSSTIYFLHLFCLLNKNIKKKKQNKTNEMVKWFDWPYSKNAWNKEKKDQKWIAFNDDFGSIY